MTPQNTTQNSYSCIKKNQLNTRKLTMIALLTAVLCVLGPWALVLPFSPIPFSLCTLGIYFAIMLLGVKAGTTSVLLYLLLGLVGLPVFTGFTGGPAKVFGPTGGYLVGYLFMALICGFVAERFAGKRVICFLGMCLGTIVCYLFGSIWMAYQLELSFGEAFFLGVLPYVPGDLVKIFVASSVSTTLRKYLSRAGFVMY